MPRTQLTIALLLVPGWALAGKNDARIKALKDQIEKLGGK
jgi:hypothetical protein